METRFGTSFARLLAHPHAHTTAAMPGYAVPLMMPARDQIETEIDQLLSNKPRQTAPPGPPAAPNPPAPPPDPPTVELNVVQENADNAGVWGGRCTCPDGNVYWVGDNLNFCASLSCLYGHSGVCHDWQGPWSRRRVTCSLAIPPPPSPAPPSPTKPPSPLPSLPPPPQPPSPCPLIPALQPTQPNSPQEMSVWESLWGRTPPPPTAAPSRPPAATTLHAQQVRIRLDLLTLMIAPALLVYTICYCARRPVTYQEDRGSRSPPPTSGTRHSAKRIPKKKRAAATFEPGVELPLAREEFDNLDIDSLHPNFVSSLEENLEALETGLQAS